MWECDQEKKEKKKEKGLHINVYYQQVECKVFSRRHPIKYSKRLNCLNFSIF